MREFERRAAGLHLQNEKDSSVAERPVAFAQHQGVSICADVMQAVYQEYRAEDLSHERQSTTVTSYQELAVGGSSLSPDLKGARQVKPYG
jgi:hypothetical protein